MVNERATIRTLPWIRRRNQWTVECVTVDVNERVVSLRTPWLGRPPRRCARGHWLLPGHMFVTTYPCSCGSHICWECECGAATYGPELHESCSLATSLREFIAYEAEPARA
jgi:hypothetical protein